MPEIAFAGRVPLAAASRITEGFQKRRKGMPIGILVLLVGLGLAIVGGLLYRGGNEDGGIKWLAYAAICIFVGGAFSLKGGPEITRKAWNIQYRGRVTDQGIRLDGTAQAILFSWTDFVEIERHENLVIGWLRSGRALPLAAEMFTDESQFQAAVAQIVGHVAAPRTS
jgi:hypothetical protein